jgi:hypothetical protein
LRQASQSAATAGKSDGSIRRRRESRGEARPENTNGGSEQSDPPSILFLELD